MARFYIDTSDERHFIRDVEGQDFPDLDAARMAAIDGLPDMARDALPDGDHRTFLALIRDEDNRTVLQASLTLSVVWLTEAMNKVR